jgi:hypothetical protein
MVMIVAFNFSVSMVKFSVFLFHEKLGGVYYCHSFVIVDLLLLPSIIHMSDRHAPDHRFKNLCHHTRYMEH